MVGVHLERALEPYARLLVVMPAHVELPDVVVRPREARVRLDRLLEHGQRVVGIVVHMLQAPARGVECFCQAGYLVIGQPVAEEVLRALARLGLARVRDAVEQHHAAEPRGAVVGDAHRRGQRAVRAFGLREDRQQRGRLVVDRQRVVAAILDILAQPAALAGEGQGAVAQPFLDEDAEDPARHLLARRLEIEPVGVAGARHTRVPQARGVGPGGGRAGREARGRGPCAGGGVLPPRAGGGLERLHREVCSAQAIGGGAEAQARVRRRRDDGRLLEGRERLVILAQHLGELAARHVCAGHGGRGGRCDAVVGERVPVRFAVGRRAPGSKRRARTGDVATAACDAVEGDGDERRAEVRARDGQEQPGRDECRDGQQADDEQNEYGRAAARCSWCHWHPPGWKTHLGTIVACGGGGV